MRFNKKAFTLVELIVYVSIVAMVLVVLVRFLWNIVGTGTRVDVSSELTYNARLAFEKISRYSREADDVIIIGKGYDSDSKKADFDGGSYNKTQWDQTNNWLELTSDGQTQKTGDFISRAFDSGETVTWDFISWSPGAPYKKELPNTALSESEYARNNADMAGNVLLMHLNESNGVINDSSGHSNNGTNNGALYNQSGRYNKALKFQSAGGQTVTIPASADSWIDQAFQSRNAGNSAWLHIYPWSPSYSRRSLVRFNLSSIPAGATINSAKLKLKEALSYGVGRTIAVHRATRDWTEGNGSIDSGVTWSRYNGINSWTTPGGDYVSPPTAQVLVSYSGWTFPKIDEWDVKSDIQAFVNGTYQNYGWLIKDVVEDTSQRFWFFTSREGSTAPSLEINYDVAGTYVEVAHNASLMPSKITAEAWIKMDALPGASNPYGIISKGDISSGDGYELFVTSSSDPQSNRIAFAIGNTAVYSLNKPATGQWIHVAGVYDGTQAKLYVNGVMQNNMSVSLQSNNRSLYIGKRYTNPAHFMSGYIDEVAIYNRDFSDAEITARYQRGVMNSYFQLRTGNSLPLSGSFLGPDGTSSTFYSEENNLTVSLPNFKITNLSAGRYIQYKAFFTTEDSALTPEVSKVGVGTGGTILGMHPGKIIFDYPVDDVIIDTYTKNIVIGSQAVTCRKLRMRVGSNPPVDITSDKVNVENFSINNRTRGNEPKNIKINFDLNYINPGNDYDREKNVSFQTAISVRKR